MSSREETLERLRSQVGEETEETEAEVVLEDLVAEEEPVEKKASTREYRIITKWTEVATIEANSAEAALDQLGKTGDKFAVIPDRNFSVFEVETEQITKTTITKLEG